MISYLRQTNDLNMNCITVILAELQYSVNDQCTLYFNTEHYVSHYIDCTVYTMSMTVTPCDVTLVTAVSEKQA